MPASSSHQCQRNGWLTNPPSLRSPSPPDDLEGYQPNDKAVNLPPDASCDGPTDSDPHNNCGRGTFDSSPPARDFAGYYMAAFKTVAQRASPAAIMCAYNVRGPPPLFMFLAVYFTC